MQEVTWEQTGSSFIAGRLIARKRSFALRLRGQSAEALRHIVGPDVGLDRETVGVLMKNVSLAALPGLMLFALGRQYDLRYALLDGGEIVMYFMPPRVQNGERRDA